MEPSHRAPLSFVPLRVCYATKEATVHRDSRFHGKPRTVAIVTIRRKAMRNNLDKAIGCGQCSLVLSS